MKTEIAALGRALRLYSSKPCGLGVCELPNKGVRM